MGLFPEPTVPAPQPPQPNPPALTAPAPLAALDWLAGTWLGSEAGSAYEEVWRRGASGFHGMFRMERGSAAVFLEAMVLEADGAEVLLRIRHFGPGLKQAWEEKDRPVVFRLALATPQEARFEGTGAVAGETLRYLRTGPAALEVTLDKTVQGTPRRSTFRFTRQP